MEPQTPWTDSFGEHDSLDLEKCSNPLCKELAAFGKLVKDLKEATDAAWPKEAEGREQK